MFTAPYGPYVFQVNYCLSSLSGIPHTMLDVFQVLVRRLIAGQTACFMFYCLLYMCSCIACRLLEQAVRGSANRNDIISPNQLTENKSENKIAEDLSVGRRKYIQENEEGERKYELPGKKLAYSKELKRTDRSFAQQEMSEVTRRKNEENHERTEGNRPSLVRRQRHKNVDETDPENTPESPLQTCTSLPQAEKGFKASLQFSVAKRRDSSGERDSGLSEGSVGDGKQNLAASLVPREDDSLLHGSSELMLVLLPQTRDTHSDRGSSAAAVNTFQENNIILLI